VHLQPLWIWTRATVTGSIHEPVITCIRPLRTECHQLAASHDFLLIAATTLQVLKCILQIKSTRELTGQTTWPRIGPLCILVGFQ